jgi:hypothetical protein
MVNEPGELLGEPAILLKRKGLVKSAKEAQSSAWQLRVLAETKGGSS